MKLTKGKINKLYKKKKQSLKKIKNKNKNKSKHHTFRKHKKINLARKSLKNIRGGGEDEIQIIDKNFGSTPAVSTNYKINAKGALTEANATPIPPIPPITPITPIPSKSSKESKPSISFKNPTPFIKKLFTAKGTLTEANATPKPPIPFKTPISFATPIPYATPIPFKTPIPSQVNATQQYNPQSIPVAVPESNEETAKKVVDVLYKRMHDGDMQDSVEAVKLAALELSKIPKEVSVEEGKVIEGKVIEVKVIEG